jgi:hypothetical protein
MAVSSRIDYWGMGNKEVLEVFLTPSCLNQYQCSKCRFIYRDILRESCLNCNNALISRDGTVYNTTAYGYLLALSALIKTKVSSEQKERTAIIDRVWDDFRIGIGWDEFKALANELHRLMGESTSDPEGNYKRHVEAHPKMVKYVKDHFGISDDNAAGRLYGMVMNYRGCFELDGPVVILAVSLTETLFDQFLISLSNARGRYEDLRREILEKGWGFKKRKTWFKRLTDMKLETYINENAWGQYVATCKSVEEIRDKYVHGFWMSIGEDTLIDALKSAGASFDFVMELNNKFCVRTT